MDNVQTIYNIILLLRHVRVYTCTYHVFLLVWTYVCVCVCVCVRVRACVCVSDILYA